SFSSLELNEAELDRVEMMEISDTEGRLKRVLDRRNIMHTKEITVWSKLAKEKDQLWFLPGKFNKGGKTYGGNFKGNVDAMIAEINKSHPTREPIDKDAMLSILKQIQGGRDIKGVESTKRLFDIRRNANGSHEVSMAGLLLPADIQGQNIGHKIMGNYTSGLTGTTALKEELESYQLYYKEALAGRKTEGRSSEALKKWIQQIYYAMAPGKDSAIFGANNISFPEGAFVTYKTADSIIAEADNVMRQLDGGSMQPALKDWFNKNPDWSSQSGRKNMKTALSNMVNMTLNTTLVTTDMLFNKDSSAQLLSGSAINLNTLVA
ncbi:MAG: hypothetical protein GY861_11320, partial [bacterium]|nr:hypothetical protein [bacterium]